jgi:hypothetical protein
LRAAVTREEMHDEILRWRAGVGAGSGGGAGGGGAGGGGGGGAPLLYTVPATKIAHGACKALAADHILPHAVGALAALRAQAGAGAGAGACTCGGAPLAVVLTSRAAAPYAALLVAALLLADDDAAALDKPAVRACLAAVQLALGIASLPREREKELWAFCCARRT